MELVVRDGQKWEIPAEELEDIETVGDVIEYLREKGIDEQAVDNKRTDPDK